MPASKTLIHDFTKGPVLKQLAWFSVPFMLSNALQVCYALADILIVGRYTGSTGLAAVSIASQVVLFMTMLCLGFSTGGQVYISQLIGSGKRDRLNAAIGTFFSSVLILGVVMTLCGIFFAKPVLQLLNTDPLAFDGAMDYMMVCSAGLLFSYGYNMVSSVLRGMGDSKNPFIFILIASILNIVLDILFVTKFGMGVFGAALATVIGQAVSFIYAIVYLYFHRAAFGFDFRWKSFLVDPAVFHALLKLGIPFAVRFAAINISMTFVNALVNSLGYQASATFGIGMRLDDFVTKITQGIMLAGVAMVGQNFGAGKIERIRKIVYSSWILSVGMYIVYAFFTLGYPKEMFALFSHDEEVLKMAPLFMTAIVWHYPALVFMRGTNALINGIGNAWLSLIFAVFDGFVLRILCSWFFGCFLSMGLYGLILGYAFASYGMAVPGMIYFLFCPWYRRKRVSV